VKTDARFKALLEALAPGQAMWMGAAGKSLWPFILGGDSLRVLRCDETALRHGDVAVVENDHGVLVAHVVVAVGPVRTASSNGRVDPPPRAVLGRVTAVRRGTVTVPLPRASRVLLRAVPTASQVLRALPGARRVVRWLRDGR
jgi:hypothetical protein